MATFWFWTVVAMLAAYATLDGFDLGAGIIYLFVSRTDEERRAVLRSITRHPDPFLWRRRPGIPETAWQVLQALTSRSALRLASIAVFSDGARSQG